MTFIAQTLLVRLQKTGVLPDPLPPYRLTVGNYLIGYSLWFSLAFGVLVWIGDRIMRRWADNAPAIDAPADWTKRAARSMAAPDRNGPTVS